jgi:hypothetical protein
MINLSYVALTLDTVTTHQGSGAYEEDGEGLGAVTGISAQAEYSERRTPIMMKSFQPSG